MHSGETAECEHSSKEEVERIALLRSFYTRLTSDYNLSTSKNISKSQRRKSELVSQDLVYGEVTFNAFLEGYNKARYFSDNDMNFFVDLGSGTGLACVQMVLLATLFEPFEKIMGIEYLDSLTKVSLHFKEKLTLLTRKQEILNTFAPGEKDLDKVENSFGAFDSEDQKIIRKINTELLEHLTLITDNFLKNQSWLEADFIFVNCTCFTLKTWTQLCTLFDKCKEGCMILSVTNTIIGTEYEKLWQKRCVMSWGDATLILQRKKTVFKGDLESLLHPPPT